MTLTEKITAVADAIRSKSGSEEKMTLEQMAAAIGSISTGGAPKGAVLTGFRMRENAADNIDRYPEPAAEPYLSTSTQALCWAYVAVPCPYDLSFFYEFRFTVGKDAASGSSSSAQLCQLSEVNRVQVDGAVTALPALPFTLGNSLTSSSGSSYGFMPVLNPSLPTGCTMFTARSFDYALAANYTDYSTTAMDYGCFAACAAADGSLFLYPAGSAQLYTWKPGMESWGTIDVPSGMVTAAHKRLAKSNSSNTRYMLFADDQGTLFMFRNDQQIGSYATEFPQVSNAYCWVYDLEGGATVTAAAASAALAAKGDVRTTCAPSIISLGLDGKVRFGLHDVKASSTCYGSYSFDSYSYIKNTCVFDKARKSFVFEAEGSDTDAFRLHDRAFRLGPLHFQTEDGTFFSLVSTNFNRFREWIDTANTNRKSQNNTSGNWAGYYYPLVTSFMSRYDTTGSNDSGSGLRYENDHASYKRYADGRYNGLTGGMIVKSSVSFEGDAPSVKNTVYKTHFDCDDVVTVRWNDVSSRTYANTYDNLNNFGASINFDPTNQMCFLTGYDGDSMYYVCQRLMPPVFMRSAEHGMVLGGFYGSSNYYYNHGVSMTLYKMEPVWGRRNHDIRMHPAPYSIPGYPHTAEEATRALPKIVSWAEGTDAEICAMVEAADKGLIKLRDYWHIGDSRKVQLSACAGASSDVAHAAQEVELVLADDLPLMRLTQPVECGRKRPEFVVVQRNCLAETDIFSTANGGWKESELRTWCNGVYIGALPATLAPIFKEIVRVTPSSCSGYSSAGIASNDRAFIPTVPELFSKYSVYESSDASTGAYSELRRFACFNDSGYGVTVKKTLGSATSGAAYFTANASNSYVFVANSNGSYDESAKRQSGKYGIAPCLCI